MNSKQILFILGRGRSGTSLMSSVLNSHSKIFIAPEGMFLLNLRQKYLNRPCTAKFIHEFVMDVYLEDKMRILWPHSPKKLEAYLISEMNEDSSYQDICNIVYLFCAKGNNKGNVIITGDKNPHYTLFHKTLISMYPNAKFLCISRDYRDNILSFQKMQFDLSDPVALAYRWNIFNQEILKLKKKYPKQTCIIKYEDLVMKPKKTLNCIVNFLGIEFDNRMLNFYNSTSKESNSWWHKNLNNNFDSKNIGKWEKKFSSQEIDSIERVCGKIGEKMGYAPQMNKNSLLKKVFPVVKAYGLTYMEKAYFYLPLRLRIKIRNYQRLIFLTK